MEEAYRQGIAGTGKHNWIFAKNVFEAIKQRTYERNSPLHLALRGTAKLTEVGGMPGMEGYDKFIEQWKSLNNPEDVQYVMSKQPTYPDEPSFERFYMNDNAFESAKNMPPFLYDATIALGLAACNVTQGDDFFDGRSHYDAFKRMRFTGATGDLFFEQDTGSRDPNSALFQMFNYAESPESEGSDEVSFVDEFTSVLVCFVGIPVMIIVEGEPKAYFFLLSSIIFVLCSALLLFMFVPKIRFHFNPEKGKQKDAVRQFVSKKYSQNSTASWTANSTVGTDQRKLSVSSVQSFSGTDINKENTELKETIASLRTRVSELENLIAKGVEEQDGKKEELPVEANVDSPVALEQV